MSVRPARSSRRAGRIGTSRPRWPAVRVLCQVRRPLTASTRVPDHPLMAEVTITLPGAPPELYLRAVNWWREATRYAVAVGSLGVATQPSRGANPITDLLDFEAPESVEALARQAIAEGRLEIAPAFRLDSVFAAQAMERGLER